MGIYTFVLHYNPRYQAESIPFNLAAMFEASVIGDRRNVP